MRKIPTTCNICGQAKGFLAGSVPVRDWSKKFSTLRENLVCRQCGSISRDRLLIWSLGKCLNEEEPLCSWRTNKAVRILEATGVRAHPTHLGQKFDYFNTVYDPRAIREGRDPRRFADFQQLHYPDRSFDYVLASDVFEHIRLDNSAFREIFRVLKPKGCFLLQVPYIHSGKTEICVKTEEGRDIFLMAPEYHAGKTLVYRMYGGDLLNNLARIGFAVRHLEIEIPEHMISRQPIFICTRSNSILLYLKSQTWIWSTQLRHLNRELIGVRPS